MAFSKMDKNGDGQLTIEELRNGLSEQKEISINPGDLESALEIIDSNKNGLIDYTEFIAACLHSQNYLKENHLKTAFAYFDKDNSGSITKDELCDCLRSDDFTMDDEAIEKLL